MLLKTITGHLAIQQGHAISKLFGFHFDGHVRVLEELSLLKKTVPLKSELGSSQKLANSPPSPQSFPFFASYNTYHLYASDFSSFGI